METYKTDLPSTTTSPPPKKKEIKFDFRYQATVKLLLFPLTTRQQYPFSERKHLPITNISVSRALRCSGSTSVVYCVFFFLKFAIYILQESDNYFKMQFQSNAFQNLKRFSDYPNSQLTTERKLFVTVNQFGASGRACGMP